MNPFRWQAVRAVPEACEASTATVAEAMRHTGGPGKSGDAIIKAGGIDVLSLLKERLLEPETLVSITGIPGLDQIVARSDGGLSIGALTTLAVLARHPLITQRYAALARAAMESASPQIRNVATIGGNLLQRPHCWYFRSSRYHCLRRGGEHCFAHGGDHRYHAIFDNQPCAAVHPSSIASALVALHAVLELQNAGGTTRRMALEDFLRPAHAELTRENDLQAQEILTRIQLPDPGQGMQSSYLRVSERQAFDWPLVEVAVALHCADGARCQRASIVLGGVAPSPHRCAPAEEVLLARAIDEQSASRAARAALTGATPLAGNGYKQPLAEALIRRAILAAGRSTDPS